MQQNYLQQNEQKVLSFQSLTFKHLGSIYLLNIIALRNVEEAEKIGIFHSKPIPVLIPVCEIANPRSPLAKYCLHVHCFHWLHRTHCLYCLHCSHYKHCLHGLHFETTQTAYTV